MALAALSHTDGSALRSPAAPVSLQGQHFTLHVREGDTVKAGQLLMEFDMAAIGELGFDLTTPVIVCNSSDFDLVKCGSKQVAPGDVLLTLTRKQN